jgi:transposase
MPYITDKTAISCPFLDKRVKLLPCQKEMVSHYRNLGWSQRKLAAHFNVSRRLITFVIDDTKKERDLQRRAERGGSMAYYDKAKNTSGMRKHRRHKYLTLKESLKQNEKTV